MRANLEFNFSFINLDERDLFIFSSSKEYPMKILFKSLVILYYRKKSK